MAREPVLSTYLHAKGKKLGLPISGTFELTARCNFNCKMCYVHLTKEEQEHRGKELTAGQWLSLAEDAKRAGMVFLLLTGGEPSIRPDFPEIYREIKKMGFIVSLNSNGYLLSGPLLELLREDPPSRLNISLYGTGNETYERLCGVPAYDRILENVQALRQAGLDVKLSMSLTPENGQDMQGVYETAKALGIHTQAAAYMFPPLRRDDGCIGQNYRLTPEEAGRFHAAYDTLTMDEETLCRRGAAIKQGMAVPGGEECDGTPGGRVQCRAGSTAFWLTWQGRMLPCGQMVEPTADVLKLGFDEAWRRIREATGSIRLPAACGSCKLANACHACAAKCYCETGRFDEKPEYVCRMTKEYVAATLAYWQNELGGRRWK